MLKIYDNVFDKFWLDQISDTLINQRWKCNNVANRETWPYGNKGSHMIMGNVYFKRINNNEIYYDENLELTKTFINAFDAIQNKSQKMILNQISANLQFCNMDGSYHIDGEGDDCVFILMLANEHVDEDIGGDFFHKTTETNVPFKYGRLIEQNGLDVHKASAFNKPNIARMSIKWVGKKWI